MLIMDGQEALAKMRALEGGLDLPTQKEAIIFMVTTMDSPKHLANAYYRGGCTD